MEVFNKRMYFSSDKGKYLKYMNSTHFSGDSKGKGDLGESVLTKKPDGRLDGNTLCRIRVVLIDADLARY